MRNRRRFERAFDQRFRKWNPVGVMSKRNRSDQRGIQDPHCPPRNRIQRAAGAPPLGCGALAGPTDELSPPRRPPWHGFVALRAATNEAPRACPGHDGVTKGAATTPRSCFWRRSEGATPWLPSSSSTPKRSPLRGSTSRVVHRTNMAQGFARLRGRRSDWVGRLGVRRKPALPRIQLRRSDDQRAVGQGRPRTFTLVVSSVPYGVLMTAFGAGIWIVTGARRAGRITGAVVVAESPVACDVAQAASLSRWPPGR